MSHLRVFSNTGGMAQTNGYVLADESTGEAVLVDAPDHTMAPLIREVHRLGWTLRGLWLTHGHFDHIADHPLVPDGPVLIHALDAPKLRDPAGQLKIFEEISGFRVPLDIDPREPDATLEDGQVLTVGGIEATVLHTPGHAPGHVSFYLKSEGILLGGDNIIDGTIGRMDLPDSSVSDLNASIVRMMSLPPETKLLPGHGRPSTLDRERAENRYVNAILERALP